MSGKKGIARQHRVTMQDIAEYCGVSKGTVSLALSDHPRIGDATKARILSAVKELGYNPALHDAARRLALLRKNTHVLNHVIALFYMPDFYTVYSGFLNQMFHGILDGVRQEGFRLLLDYLTVWPEGSPLLPLFERSTVDGTILFGRSWDTETIIEQLRNTAGFVNRPIVTLLSQYPGCSLINSDDAQATYRATCHLLDLGHRYFFQWVFQKSDLTCEPQDRVNGIRQALREAGLDPARHLFLCKMQSSWLNPSDLPYNAHPEASPIPDDESSRILLETIKDHPEITAVLALNDASAFRSWQVLLNAGYHVPSDISIIGFDDTNPVLNDQGANILTTVRVPLYQIGVEAARLVSKQAIQDTVTPTTIIVPTELVIRKSTAPAKR